MKCLCGRYLTQQTRAVAKLNKLDGSQCLHCMSYTLEIPYQILLDQYNGIVDCRECKKKKLLEERRKLLGL